ncbi:DUF3224 domain-containing protein [Pyxidicoccus sp. 3LG]
MMKRASGPFDVKVTPVAQESGAWGEWMARLTLDKQFHGDVEATSQGQMLASPPGAEGSGGYVALERVSGKLHGREGTFVLQHSGTMDRGAQSLTITVVPGTGTGQLKGLAGSMNIIIDGEGRHAYAFEYTLPE